MILFRISLDVQYFWGMICIELFWRLANSGYSIAFSVQRLAAGKRQEAGGTRKKEKHRRQNTEFRNQKKRFVLTINLPQRSLRSPR
jgi:hypothetical protein